MDLNERIKLSKWSDILSNHFQAYVNSKLTPYDLTFSEFIFLLNLYENNGVSQEFMTKRKYTDKSAITRTLQSLEKKELVTREKNSLDKRINYIYLTEKSLNYKNELNKIIDDWQDFLNDCISREEYEKIANALENLTIKVLTKLGKK